MPTFKAGQSWSVRGPDGSESARLVIGAVIEIAGRPAIACCSAIAAPAGPSPSPATSETVPFLPLAIDALAASVVALDAAEQGAVDGGFLAALEAWRADPRGLTVFNVPFDGSLDRLIARQMASIIGVDPSNV